MLRFALLVIVSLFVGCASHSETIIVGSVNVNSAYGIDTTGTGVTVQQRFYR